MSDLKYVPFNVPKDLLKDFDEWWKEKKYANRTEALRALMREKLKES